MRSCVIHIRHELFDGHKPHFGCCFHVLPLSRPEQPLHQVVLRRCSAILPGTVLPNDLEDLRPQPVRLRHVGVCNRHIRRLDRRSRSWMLGKEPKLTGDHLALDPPGTCHCKAFDQLRRNDRGASSNGQPFPRVLINLDGL